MEHPSFWPSHSFPMVWRRGKVMANAERNSETIGDLVSMGHFASRYKVGNGPLLAKFTSS